MRICLYTETALPKMGGQELVVDALARQYLALGHEPIVLAPYPRKLKTADQFLPYRVERHMRFFSTHYFVGWYRRYLRNLHLRHHFDVIHCHGIYPPSFLASLVKSELGVPIVVTSHGGDVYESNVRLRKNVIAERSRAGLGSADALIAISRFTREGFTRISPESASRIVDIPNGVNLEEFADATTTPPPGFERLSSGKYAVVMGRLKYRKGVDVLLRATALSATACDATVAIVGDGEERAYLELLCDQLGIADQVRFFGKLSGSMKLHVLRQARFAVVPSRLWEAFGLVALESFAAGLPVIASDLPGLADLVTPNRTGLLVPPEQVDALSAAMTRLYTDDALVAQMSVQARSVVRAYDWRIIAQRHLALYQNLQAPRRALAA